jgi:RecA-family ATPase
MASWDERFPMTRYDPTLRADPVPWLVEGFWQSGKINAMFGLPDAGKSRLLGWLLTALMGGLTEVIGCRINQSYRPKHVMYLAGEETDKTVCERLANYTTLLGLPNELPLDITFTTAPGMQLNRYKERVLLEQRLLDEEVDCLIIEPLRRVHGGNENDSSEMSDLHNVLRRWSNVLGITEIIIHHTGKIAPDADMDQVTTWSRGTTDFPAIMDASTFLMQMRKKRGWRKLKVLSGGRFPSRDPLYVEDWSDNVGFKASIEEDNA